MKKLLFILSSIIFLALTSCTFTPTQKPLAKVTNLEMPLWVENNIYITSNGTKILEDKNCVFYPILNQSKDKIIYSHKSNFITMFDAENHTFSKIYELHKNKSNYTATCLDWSLDGKKLLILLKEKNGLIAKNELIEYDLDSKESKLVDASVTGAKYFKDNHYLISNNENIYLKDDKDAIVKVLKSAKGAKYEPIANLNLSKDFNKLVYNIGPDYYIYEFRSNKNVKIFVNTTQNIAHFNSKDEIIVSDYNKISTYNYKDNVYKDFLKVKKNSFAQW